MRQKTNRMIKLMDITRTCSAYAKKCEVRRVCDVVAGART
jgi:hypothetical protein